MWFNLTEFEHDVFRICHTLKKKQTALRHTTGLQWKWHRRGDGQRLKVIKFILSSSKFNLFKLGCFAKAHLSLCTLYMVWYFLLSWDPQAFFRVSWTDSQESEDEDMMTASFGSAVQWWQVRPWTVGKLYYTPAVCNVMLFVQAASQLELCFHILDMFGLHWTTIFRRFWSFLSVSTQIWDK